MPCLGRRLMSTLAVVGCLCAVDVAISAEDVVVVTEEFPPYNYTKDGEVTGLATEVVQAVLKELKVSAKPRSLPWSRAYQLALLEEKVLIYSINRTPEREALFKWVGIVTPADQWFLFTTPRSGHRVADLDDARKLRIGTAQGDVGEQFLIGKGFVTGENLKSNVSNRSNYLKLKAGRIDVWIANRLMAAHLVREAGGNPQTDLVAQYRVTGIGNDGSWMAFGARTPDDYVRRFSAGLEAIKRNGVYEAICDRWLRGPGSAPTATPARSPPR